MPFPVSQSIAPSQYRPPSPSKTRNDRSRVRKLWEAPLSGQYVPYTLRRRLKRVSRLTLVAILVCFAILLYILGDSGNIKPDLLQASTRILQRPIRLAATSVVSPVVLKDAVTLGSTDANGAAVAISETEIEELRKRIEEEETARATASRLQRKKFDDFEDQIQQMKRLASSTFPLKLLRYCSNPRYKPSNANYLVSIESADGTVTNLDFGPSDSPRYNPNLLPFPKGYKYPYLGFARQSPVSVLVHHEVVFCEMEWVEAQDIDRDRTLRCAGPTHFTETLDLPGWPSPPGTCKEYEFLHLEQGHTDPRIFFSPSGEPLMVIGTNGLSNCLNQYVIDLRAIMPDLSQKMDLTDVPVKYNKLTELPRDHYNEIEKNWFLMWDEKNLGYVQHEIERRSVSFLDATPAEIKNLVPAPFTPPEACVGFLTRITDPDVSHIYLHQATNSLRVTLCDFPCIPTVHNTVLIEMVHLKYKATPNLYYKRYVIVMNATAPFDIIGRTGNIMYAGTDDDTMVYTMSMVWDHQNHPGHVEWNEEEHGTIVIPEGYEQQEEKPISVTEIFQKLREEDDDDDASSPAPQQLRKRAVDDLTSRSATDGTSAVPEIITFPVLTEHTIPRVEISAQVQAAAAAEAASQLGRAPSRAPQRRRKRRRNSLVNPYYHGWLDDTLLISIGIDDTKTQVMHAHARDLLECLHLCETP
ncbi:hypothetical protein V1512DRAFT_251995 [Lipomyces arxii]|uniref:uncharacterized protein n=1 Tax=Lipomyces arxii TaxID=56418 RepID=UPI0034CF0DC8